MKSLLGRLLLVVLGVAFLSVAATAAVTQRITRDDLAADVERDLELEVEIIREVSSYAYGQPSWDGVEPFLNDLADGYGIRVALTDLDGRPIADSAVGANGTDVALPASPTAIIDPDNLAIAFEPSPEDAEFFELQFELLFECFEERGVPVDVDAIREGVVPDFGELTIGEQRRAELCYADAEIIDGCEAGFDCGEPIFIPDFNDFEIPIAPAALLFLGDASSTGSLFGGGLDARLILVVLAMFALAGLATWWAVRKVLEPVDHLRGAVAEMGAGNLAVRVPEAGTDELSELAGSFNRMASSLQAEDHRRRRFSSDVAHELRTPLANVRGYLEAAQDGVADIDRALIDSLHEDTLQLQHLVDDLSTLTVSESGQMALQTEDHDLASFVDGVVGAHRAAAVAANVRLSIGDLPDVTVLIDRRRMRQVVGNLITNAIRHTAQGGQVLVHADRSVNVVRIHVADSGEGIPTDQIEQVFERFHRVDGSRNRATGGSGLGLAISRRLTEAHGGRLSATSEVGTGSVFTVTLPVGESAAG